MVKLNTDFKPDKGYTPYLMLFTSITVVPILLVVTLWLPLIFLDINPAMFLIAWVILAAICIAVVIWILIWAALYYKTVVYHLNSTEMTWKRGVLFRKTGIVPYNRITNVDIVQGPLMRLFGISHLKIDTASGSGKDKSEILLEGIADPEPVRTMIMDFVRGHTPAPAALGTEYKNDVSDASLEALVAEVREIRKLLERK